LVGRTACGEFRVPLECFRYHFAFYGVTGSGKTRAAMGLAVGAENCGLRLRVVDVEGEWARIIPELSRKTLYYDVACNLRINPFELGDIGLVRAVLRETIFGGIELEYRDLSPQMNYVLDKCIQESESIPELIENVVDYEADTPFPLRNLEATKAALLTRLNPFRDNPVLRRIFYVERGTLDIERVGDRNLLVNLHDLDRRVVYGRELRLIYNVIATAYLRHALSREETDEITDLFVLDEAQLLVPKIFRKATATDTWTTTEFATRLRKRGVSLAVITQSPTNIEDDIRKNTQNLLIFRLQDRKDVETVAGMLGHIHIDEVSYLLKRISKLKAGEALIKMALVDGYHLVRMAV